MMTEHGEFLPAPENEAVEASPTENNLIQYRAAGFWVRLLAFILDLMVVAGLNAIIWGSIIPGVNQESFLYKLFHTNALFLGITGALYFILMTRYFQQTLGKMIFGIKVVQPGDKPLDWITVIFRELIARSLSQLMGLNLGYVVCWFNADKRCAHDYLSDTWVVYEKPVAESNLIRL